MGVKFRNPPIFYSLSQVRFNVIGEMGDYVQRLQRQWRAKYPDFSYQALNQLQFQMPGPTQQPEIKQSVTPRWHFKNADQNAGYVLTTESIVFHTTKYETSEAFFSELLTGLKTINEVVDLAYIESVSFRTLDVVSTDSAHGLDFFLNPHLLGLSSQLEGSLKHSFSELVLRNAEEQLTARVALLSGKVGIPADLMPMQLTLTEKARSINNLHAILDNDCVHRKRFSLDLEKAAQALSAVKKSVTSAFKKSVTAEALEFWQ